MGFLQRSKSAAVPELHTKKKDSKVVEPLRLNTTLEEKRSTSFDRPKTSQSTSFSRPRTANASIGRTSDFPPPTFRIDFKADDEIFSFPMVPSPSSETELPSIGLAIGSPNQVRPSWGRSLTADHVSDRMPVPPPPTRPPPALPEHPDLEMPLTDIKRRKSNWKNFGSLFTRKSTNTIPTEPFYKLHLVKPNIDKPAILVRDEVFQEMAKLPTGGTSPMPSHHQRSPSLTRTQARFEARAEADMASFMRKSQPRMLRSPSMIQKEGLSPMFREIQGLSEDSAWTNDLRKDSPLSLMSMKSLDWKTSSPVAVPGTPTLVLDLPDPKFERYSVMFEKVLDDSRPSLLERRQSRLNRNASVRKLELSARVEEHLDVPRLAVKTAPGLAPSPGLAKSLSMKIGKKVLSPVGEVFSALNRPRPLRRVKTMPKLAASPMLSPLPSSENVVSAISPVSTTPTQEQSSEPATPMTMTTISECDSIEVISTDIPIELLDKSEPAWDMITSQQPRESCLVAPLNVKSANSVEKSIVQLSVAKQISLSKAVAQLQESMEKKNALRPKVVELGKTRTSTLVVIESINE